MFGFFGQKNLSILKHSGYVNELILLKNGNLASANGIGIDMNTIKIWSAKTGDYKCIHTFKGHSEPITSLKELPNNIIVSGSDDHTLRFWDYANRKFIKKIEDPKLYK